MLERLPVCPNCLEVLSGVEPDAAARRCPRCGHPAGPSSPEVRPTKAVGGRRPWVSALVGIIALGVIGGAGAVIYQKVAALREDQAAAGGVARATPEGRPGPGADPVSGRPPGEAGEGSAGGMPRPGNPRDDPAWWSHSRLVVVPGPGGADSRPVLALARPTGELKPVDLGEIQKGLLLREIVRQAVLLAARDELGLGIRDEVLGDPFPTEKAEVSGDVAALLRLNGPASVKIGLGDGDRKGIFLDGDLRPSSGMHDILDLTRAAEKFSRTEFPRALKALGAEGKPNAVRAAGEVPGPTEARLSGLGLVEPLAGVREVHEAIRKDGESPERLGALVRGYAMLGILNEPLWTPAHKVFKARALLYAQRLVARDPASPWGLWHRAFAEAMAGLHGRALDDIREAETLAAKPGSPPAPAWLATVARFCHFDIAGLEKADESQARLAAFLRMIAFEFPRHSVTALQAARDVLALDPGCFRAHEVVFQVGGVSNLHVETEFAPGVLSGLVPRRLRALAASPPAVRDAVDRGAGEPAMVRELEKAGRPAEDAGEPSWAAVGSMIRETRFVLVQHRIDFMKHAWGVPVDEFWDEARPLVAGHRYQPYLIAEVIPTPEAFGAFARSVDDRMIPELEFGQTPMITLLSQVTKPNDGPAWRLLQHHMDHLSRDFASQIQILSAENVGLRVHNANKILGLSPDNGYAMSILIEEDWEHSRARVPEWEKKAVDFPAVVGALGRRYSLTKDYAKARDCLERFIARAPEAWAFTRLAKNFREQGDDANWLATLDRYLASGEDHGLEQARVRVEIADYYMKKTQWEKARPYAEAAAETWAAWAMQCAMRCAEGMKDWDRAEAWARRVSERYAGSTRSRREWLNFCKRTGHGDRKAAEEYVAQFEPAGEAAVVPAAPAGNAPAPAVALEAGFDAWLKGSTRRAAEHFTKAAAANPFLADCSLMAIADDQGDAARRDALLAELCANHRARSPKMVQALELFRAAFARGDREVPDLKALADAIADIKPNVRGNAEFYVGWLLRKRGHRTEANSYLGRSIESPSTHPWLKQIAAEEIRRAEGVEASKR